MQVLEKINRFSIIVFFSTCEVISLAGQSNWFQTNESPNENLITVLKKQKAYGAEDFKELDRLKW